MIRSRLWRLLTMTMCSVAFALPAAAQTRSDAACADAVDFAMRSAEHRAAGKSRDEISRSIHDSFPVFQQQYPDLDEAEMQRLLAQVFEHRWTRFVAARTTARDCARQLQPTGPLVWRADRPAHRSAS